MLDDRQITPSSQLEDLVIWTKQTNAFGWRCYLGDLYGADDIPYTAAAARAEDLSGLPEAYVCVGGADGFRDEDIIYAMRLYGAGVPTELHVYPIRIQAEDPSLARNGRGGSCHRASLMY